MIAALTTAIAQPSPLAPDLRSRMVHRIAMHVPAAPFRIATDRPLVTFTFDDVPQSAARGGAELLLEHGAHGTFFVSGALIGTRTDHWKMIEPEDLSALVHGGHEIGCHTFEHVSAVDADPDRIVKDTKKNLAFLRQLEPDIKIDNFAFPYGRGSFGLKRKLADHFRSGRSIMPNINTGWIDLQFLGAMPLIDRQMTPGTIDRILDRALANNGWVIFYTHDVKPQPSPYGCSPALLAYALAAARAREIETVTVRDGLKAIGANGSVP